MSLTFHIENPHDVIPDIEKYFIQHWEEVAENKDTIPLDIDLETYKKLYDAGVLHLIVARDNTVAVGYMVWIVKEHMRYKSSLTAIADVFWLHPNYRKGRQGLAMFQFAERYFKSLGVARLSGTCKVAHPLDSLFQGLGWRHVENCYTKVLKE